MFMSLLERPVDIACLCQRSNTTILIAQTYYLSQKTSESNFYETGYELPLRYLHALNLSNNPINS